MPVYTVYDNTSGRVLASGSAPTNEDCLMQARETHESVLVGRTVPQEHYLHVVTLEPIPMGDKPSQHHVFDWTRHGWIDPRSTENRRQDLCALVTARRWEIETSGITLQNGVRVLTGKPDQDRITAVIVNADIAGIDAVDFKADSGWVRLTIDELRGVARAIGLHVQACFSTERMHHTAIDQLRTEAETEVYDVSAGWPVTNNSI